MEDVARQAPPPQKDIDIDLSSNVTSDLPKHLARVVEILVSFAIVSRFQFIYFFLSNKCRTINYAYNKSKTKAESHPFFKHLQLICV